MARYRITEGRHTDANGKDWNKGDIIESNKDLCKIFQNKFELVSGDPEADKAVKVEAPAPTLPDKTPVSAIPPVKVPPPIPAPVAPAAPAVLPIPEAPAAPEVKQASPLGTDITDRFPAAGKAHLKVFRTGKDYSVTEESDIAKALNDKPLTKVQVDEFIKAYDAE